ncbi:MAG: transcriptional repressor [Nitrospirae bacterium]|nr:transcriptional repressor [Nitrospirota bacterium]MBI5695523.1 transcriptional repressor [Nitrospirota bacterium]
MANKIADLNRYIAKKGLKVTRQREAVAEVFFAEKGHISAEELYMKVAKSHPGIGLTTVYRTLKLLTEAGLAKERRFGEPQGVYEKEDEDRHHDHLICTRCGKIVEFKEPSIEEMQEDVARRYGFVVTDHKMELYGLCRTCSTA